MSDVLIDQAVDNPTPTLQASVYTDVKNREDDVLVGIHDQDVLPTSVDDFIDFVAVRREDWEEIPPEVPESYGVWHMSPLERGWVRIGTLTLAAIRGSLLDDGYVDQDASLDDIEDVRAFESQPVTIVIIGPGF